MRDDEKDVEQTRGRRGRENKKTKRQIRRQMEGMGVCGERDKSKRRWRWCIRLYVGSAAAANRGGAMDPASDRHTRAHVHAAIKCSVQYPNK